MSVNREEIKHVVHGLAIEAKKSKPEAHLCLRLGQTESMDYSHNGT
jgi:hypothetical protein